MGRYRHPPKRESLSCPFQFESLRRELEEPKEFEAGRFRGLALIFNSPVETLPNRTKFRPGSFTSTIRQRGDRVKILSQHDQSAIWIGVPVRLEERREGLFVEVSLNKTKGGQETAAALRHLRSIGKLAAAELSIGFDALNFTMEEDEDTGRCSGSYPKLDCGRSASSRSARTQRQK